MAMHQHFRVAGWGLVLLTTLLVACSHQQMYHAIQENRLNDCEKYPGIQRDECRAHYQMDYEEYRRQRDVLMDK